MAVLTSSTTWLGPAARIVSGGSPPLAVSLKLMPAKLFCTETAGTARSSRRSSRGRHGGRVRGARRRLPCCPRGRPGQRREKRLMADLRREKRVVAPSARGGG